MKKSDVRFMDFLYSLDGRMFLIAACFSRGIKIREICSLLGVGRGTVTRAMTSIRRDYRAFQEDIASGEEEEEGPVRGDKEPVEGSLDPGS